MFVIDVCINYFKATLQSKYNDRKWNNHWQVASVGHLISRNVFQKIIPTSFRNHHHQRFQRKVSKKINKIIHSLLVTSTSDEKIIDVGKIYFSLSMTKSTPLRFALALEITELIRTVTIHDQEQIFSFLYIDIHCYFV